MQPIKHLTTLLRAGAALTLTLALAACGGDSGPPPPSVGSATVGAAGGTVDGPDGTRLTVPPGALAANVTLQIAQDATGAPPLDGINAASPVYAVTPHGQVFDSPALFAVPLAAGAVPEGETPVLLKAESGGKWRVVTSSARVAGMLSADISELSWFVFAYCSRIGATTGWIIGAVDCPAASSLKLELMDSNGTPVAVIPGNNGTLPPIVTVSGPTTLNMRLVWTRAPGTTRTDQIAVAGTPGGFSANQGFASSWTAVEDVRTDTTRYFTITIDPARVPGAAAPGGRELRVLASSSYSATAFQVGFGNVPVGFEFSTYLPIRVRYTGTQPVITQQPTPTSVSVVENNTFTLTAAATAPNLSYEWRYYQNAGDSAVRAAEGTNNQASYTSPAAALGWNGRLYYVQVCSNRSVAGLERCLFSQVSTLTVAAFTQAATITAQPAARDILEGEGTTFAAGVTGTPTPTLRWYSNVGCSIGFLGVRACSGTPLNNGAGSGALAGATVSGADGATLTLGSVPLSANGTRLALQATQPGFANGIWSDVVTLSVRERAVAASFAQPLATPRSVQQGGSIDFSVTVAGTRPVNTNWGIGNLQLVPGTITNGPCAGAVASFPAEGVLRLSNVPLGCDGTNIVVAVDNVATPPGARPTSTAVLNVTQAPSAPSVTAQPAGSTVNEGNRATLSVGYAGTGPVTLTLQRFVGGNWADAGSTPSAACASPCPVQTPTLEVVDNGAMFGVRLSNAQGSINSSAVTITVNMTRPPLFTAQPVNATVDANLNTAAGTATFNFVLSDEIGTLTWQWLVNGQPLADGSGVAGNGVLQQASVLGATGIQDNTTPGTLTLSNVPQAANGATLAVRITRSSGSQSTVATSRNAVLTVNTGVPANALTALQVVATYEANVVLRPDRSVWSWGNSLRNDGSFGYNIPLGQEATRPVRMYASVLSDVYQVAAGYDSYYALKGTPGSTGSRVLHWGVAWNGTDGRGADGNGNGNGATPTRYNFAAPVEVLQAGSAAAVDRVCAIAGNRYRLVMLRAINDQGQSTDCLTGSAKTVWLTGQSHESGNGEYFSLANKLTGLPQSASAGYSAPSVIFAGPTSSGTLPMAVALEDGRTFAMGSNNYNGFGMAAPVPQRMGNGAPHLVQIPAAWGVARGFGMGFYNALFVLRDDGSISASGYNSDGELGTGSGLGAAVDGPLSVLAETCTGLPCLSTLTGASAVVSNDALTTLVLKNGQLLGWGNRLSSGLLGVADTTTTRAKQEFPVAIAPGLSGFSALSSGSSHALAIGPGNVVYSWGSNLRNALGEASNNLPAGRQSTPTMVTVP